MTLTDLKRLIAIWQERLNLLDWTIRARWCTPEEAEEDYGFCKAQAETKEAEIALTHPKYYSEEDKARKVVDPEVFIVHELAHIPMAVFKTEEGSAEEIAEENIVNLFSRLLVALDRRDDSITGRKLSRRASLKPRTTIAAKSKVNQNKSTKTEASEEGSEGADTGSAN